MDLFEYQARDLFESHGVPVLGGAVAFTPEEAEAAAASMGGRVVVKAQVKVGGRGKAGGVKLAESASDAREKAGAILGMDIKGHTVRTVMIAAAAPIEAEYYLSILLDRSNRTFLVMASVSGGMDIEEVAHTAPEKLAKIPVSAVDGISLAKAQEIVKAAAFPADVADQVAQVLLKLWEVFQGEDATLVEVNPLVKTKDGKVIALDGKVTLDDNADFRQPDHEALVDTAAENPLEAAAKEKGLNYVKLEGQVGIIGNGAGLVMSTLDVVAYAGEKFGGVKPSKIIDHSHHKFQGEVGLQVQTLVALHRKGSGMPLGKGIACKTLNLHPYRSSLGILPPQPLAVVKVGSLHPLKFILGA